MALWAVGAVINIIGSILINLGTNIIKLGHTHTAAAIDGKPPKLLRTPRLWWHTPGNKVWLGGMASFSVGNLLNFASFAFAAQSLLSALGVVQFISNIIFGRFVNNEKVTKRVVFATVVVCTGCILLVLFGNHESPTLSTHDMMELYSHPAYIAYLCFIFTCSPAMYAVYRHGKRAVLADRSGAAARKWARWLPISYSLFAGVIGTQSVLYGKTISMLLRTTFSGDSQFDTWYMWVSILLFLFFAGFWMSRYSKAMKLFPVLIIMPIIQIVWVLFSMLCGMLYYQEYTTMTALSGSMFGLGVVVLLAGVFLLTGGQAAMAQPPPRELEIKMELTDEERERVGELDAEALRSKAPLSDNLDVVVSSAMQELEPEEALVARKLSTVYERQTAQSATSRASLGAGGGNLGSSPAARLAAAGARPSSGAAAAAPRRSLPGGEEGSVSEESQAVLVVEGARDSSAPDAAWPASGRGGSSGGAAGGGPRLASVIVEGSEEGGSGVPSSEPSLDAVGAAQQPSLAHDLRSDWGVGMRDLSAVMRASVGMCQADDEGTAFSLWSMPMPLSASFTSQGPGASARRHSSMELPTSATFRLRSVFEATARGGSPGPATADDLGGSRLKRPGHRRINRSRSANELDDMLRAAALGEDVDVGAGGTPDLELGPPFGGAGSAAGGSLTGPPHRHHPSSGSAPVLSAMLWDNADSGRGGAATLSPAAAAAAVGASSSDVQSLSAAGSAPRRPFSAEPPSGGVGASPPPSMAGLSPAFSPSSQKVDDSEGPFGMSPPLREGGVPVSEFMSLMSMSPPGSQSSIGLAARAREASRKGDEDS